MANGLIAYSRPLANFSHRYIFLMYWVIPNSLDIH